MENINRSFYSIIPAHIRYDNELPPNAKLLYGEITALSNQEGYCWATNDYFAKHFNVHKKSITRWIAKLQNKGYIWVQLLYKGDSKEVQERKIYIMPISDLPPPLNCGGGRNKNEGTPGSKKVEDNNTVFNNTYETIRVHFNESCKDLPQIRGITEKRRKVIQARIKDYSMDDIKEVIKKAGSSRFLNGHNDKNWKASYDWIMKPNNFIKILEGNYDNREGVNGGDYQTQGNHRGGQTNSTAECEGDRLYKRAEEILQGQADGTEEVDF